MVMRTIVAALTALMLFATPVVAGGPPPPGSGWQYPAQGGANPLWVCLTELRIGRLVLVALSLDHADLGTTRHSVCWARRT